MNECIECGHEPLEPRKRVQNNEVIEDGLYCPDCEEEYDEEPIHWDEQNFPIWIRYEAYDDHFGLLRSLEGQCEADRRTIPDEFSQSGSPFKYTVLDVYYKIEESGKVTGPYESRGDEETLDI